VAKYRPKDVPELLRTAGGRRQIRDGLLFRLWPALSRLALFHRRTIARRVRVVAVTGSYGKSTTARAIAAALGAPMHPAMSHNAWTSLARAVLRIRPWQRHAVVETGISGTGQMARYARIIAPDVAVATSIGSEHHPTMPTLEHTRAEKGRLVQALRPGGTAVLNGDDPHTRWMATLASGRVVTFGFGPACDVRASDVRLDWPHGTRFRIDAFGASREVRVKLIGRTMVYPVLAAIAVARVEGIALDDAVARCEALPPTPGRLEPVLLPSGAILLRDEYKGSRETIHAALDLLAEIPAARKIVLLGDLSEIQGREWRHYVLLGMRVARVASRFVTVGRGCFRRYWAGARKAGMPRSAVTDAGRTVQDAASHLRKMLRPGDVLLVKGRRGQKLDRVRLILQGRDVGCTIKHCEVHTMECDECPMLERGWGTHRAITPGWITPRADRAPPRA
jgi:UDP-N-acetylmuramoyl-tripeptide--D-alanyl-D-alanine ligase